MWHTLEGVFFIQMSDHWEPSPRHMVRLDVRSLLQDAAIEEVRSSKFDIYKNYFSLQSEAALN